VGTLSEWLYAEVSLAAGKFTPCDRMYWTLEAGTRGIGDLFSAKAEELPLFSPAGRQPRRQAHQCLGGELRRFSAINDGRGDVGRQPGKTQEGIEVGCPGTLLHCLRGTGDTDHEGIQRR
jgi:hypothetical protein